MKFTRKTFEAQPYIYVDRKVPYGPEIADAMGSAFGEIFGFIGKNAIRPLSMPLSVYVEMDPKVLKFRGGVLVGAEDAAKANGNIKADELPAGDAMCATHLGAYDNLNVSHKAMWDHMKKKKIDGVMPVWEIYVDDPTKVKPEKLRTEIYKAIAG